MPVEAGSRGVGLLGQTSVAVGHGRFYLGTALDKREKGRARAIRPRVEGS